MTAKGRKVALVYDAIFPYVKGGGERRFYEIARLLAEDGYDVHLYGMKFWDGPAVRKQGKVTLHGLCKARPLYTKSGRRSISQMLFFGLSCFKLLPEKIDIIDCANFPYFSMLPCRIVAWTRRKPLYATWHEVWGKQYWIDYAGRSGIVGYYLEKFTMQLPDVCIAVSDNTADRLRQLLPKKNIQVIKNSVDVSHVLDIKSNSHKNHVVYAGRLMDFKHIDVLLHSIAIAKKTTKNISCTIIGDGPEKQKLESLTQKLKLEKHIIFTGFFENHDDVLAYVKASKVFVLPSSREGFGIAVIEANAAGVPVITVDEPDNFAQKLIKGDNGIVTKLRADDLAAAITRALETPFSAVSCVERARQYDWQQTINKLKEVLV